MRLLAVSGSLRRDSHNSRLLRAAAQQLPPGVELELYDGLKQIPPFDEDDETTPSPEVMRCFSLLVVASYKYKWPQLSRSENQRISFDFGKYRQLTRLLPDSKNVGTFSSSTSRTSPVAASAMRNCSRLWSRDVETNATCAASGLHWTSSQSPRQARSSQSDERC